jgi:hypothetical protein
MATIMSALVFAQPEHAKKRRTKHSVVGAPG